MKQNIKRIIFLVLIFSLANCKGQIDKSKSTLSDDFDKAPPFYYGMPENLSAEDTSPAFTENGQKLLLTGRVFHIDGKTPASNILLYYYQTGTNGKYLHKESEERSMPPNKLGQTHGYIRGWVKTDKNGHYAIYTIRPGSYPSGDEPAHIHLNIKEPELQEHYYVDDFVFDDDKLQTTERRKKMQNRGGTGMLRLVQKDNLHIGERNIILGLNIPGYSKKNNDEIISGKNIGEDIISFTPNHAWGPDRGTKTCPICKYGWYNGILYFVGNNPDWNEIKLWLKYLEKESIKREEYLKAYFIYGNEIDYNEDSLKKLLFELGKELDLKKVALTFVPSFSDVDSEVNLNKINPDVDNTFLVYKRSNIIDKYINFKPSKENFDKLSKTLDLSKNEFFDLPRAKNGN